MDRTFWIVEYPNQDYIYAPWSFAETREDSIRRYIHDSDTPGYWEALEAGGTRCVPVKLVEQKERL